MTNLNGSPVPKEFITSINQARQVGQRLKPSRKWQPMVKTPEPAPRAGGTEFDSLPGEVWQNQIYAVNVWRKAEAALLGIMSLDGEARHDWRDFQAIKNDVVGAEWEAVELYPAESRLIDPSNYYYLWARPAFPEIGKHIGRQIIHPGKAFAPQRGWHPDQTPKEVLA